MVRDIANPNRVNIRISVLPTRPFPGRRRDLVHSAQTGRVRRAGSCTRRRFDLRCSLARNLKTRPYDWSHMVSWLIQIDWTSNLSLGTPRFARDFLFAP